MSDSDVMVGDSVWSRYLLHLSHDGLFHVDVTAEFDDGEGMTLSLKLIKSIEMKIEVKKHKTKSTVLSVLSPLCFHAFLR